MILSGSLFLFQALLDEDHFLFDDGAPGLDLLLFLEGLELLGEELVELVVVVAGGLFLVAVHQLGEALDGDHFHACEALLPCNNRLLLKLKMRRARSDVEGGVGLAGVDGLRSAEVPAAEGLLGSEGLLLGHEGGLVGVDDVASVGHSLVAAVAVVYK